MYPHWFRVDSWLISPVFWRAVSHPRNGVQAYTSCKLPTIYQSIVKKRWPTYCILVADFWHILPEYLNSARVRAVSVAMGKQKRPSSLLAETRKCDFCGAEGHLSSTCNTQRCCEKAAATQQQARVAEPAQTLDTPEVRVILFRLRGVMRHRGTVPSGTETGIACMHI